MRYLAIAALVALVSIETACGSSSSKSAATTTTNTTPSTQTGGSGGASSSSTTSDLNKKYGTFAAATHQGTSDGVVAIPAAAKAGLVTARHSGSSNFAIEGLTAQNSTGELLVNTIGAYTGTTAFGFDVSGNSPVKLKVTASGPWAIKISPISTAPVVKSPARGKGDAVHLWEGKATTWAITNRGQGNFAVINHGSGLLGDDLLVNEIGAYHGSVPVQDGPAVTTITSDGTWTITFK